MAKSTPAAKAATPPAPVTPAAPASAPRPAGYPANFTYRSDQDKHWWIDTILKLEVGMLGTVPENANVYDSYLQEKMLERLELFRKNFARSNTPLADRLMPTGDELLSRENLVKLIGDEKELITDRGTEGNGKTTFFRKKDGSCYLWSTHQVLGMLGHIAETIMSGDVRDNFGMADVSQLANKVRRCVGVKENKIAVPFPARNMDLDALDEHPLVVNGPDGLPICARPLRTTNLKTGKPQVALVCSDVLPKGTELRFTMRILKDGGVTPEMLYNMLVLGGEISGLGQWRGSGQFGRYRIIHFMGVDGAGALYDLPGDASLMADAPPRRGKKKSVTIAPDDEAA